MVRKGFINLRNLWEEKDRAQRKLQEEKDRAQRKLQEEKRKRQQEEDRKRKELIRIDDAKEKAQYVTFILSPNEHSISKKFLSYIPEKVLNTFMKECRIVNINVDNIAAIQFESICWDWSFERVLWIAFFDESSPWFSLPRDIVLNIIDIVQSKSTSALTEDEESIAIINFIYKVNFDIAMWKNNHILEAIDDPTTHCFPFIQCRSYLSSITGQNIRKYGKKTKVEYRNLRLKHLLLNRNINYPMQICDMFYNFG
jgi:hypothetical protein